MIRIDYVETERGLAGDVHDHEIGTPCSELCHRIYAPPQTPEQLAARKKFVRFIALMEGEIVYGVDVR